MTTKILSLGDSWFHYPKGLDKDGNIVFFPMIQETLSKGKGVGNIPFYLNQKFAVSLNYHERSIGQIFDSAANVQESLDDNFGACGEELMVMVYGRTRKEPKIVKDRRTWLELLTHRIHHYLTREGVDNVILLLSGGGNDIVDNNLSDFLGIDSHGKGYLKLPELNNAINHQLKDAYLFLFKHLCTTFPTIQIHFVVHGYDYAPVNGKGVFTEAGVKIEKRLQKLPTGPWLSPSLRANNITDRAIGESIIASIIDEFNDMLQSLQIPFDNGTIHYLDLRNTADRNNKDNYWANELHYNRETFIEASKKFYKVITEIIKEIHGPILLSNREG